MNPVSSWFLTLLQQTLAILFGGLVAVGWGRKTAEWVGERMDDVGWHWVGYIDIPWEGRGGAYYYIGLMPPAERPHGLVGEYFTSQQCSAEYFRQVFTPAGRIRSKERFYLAMMETFQAQEIYLRGNTLRPSQNSWRPRKPFGRFGLLDT
jgi:hypothetical protein